MNFSKKWIKATGMIICEENVFISMQDREIKNNANIKKLHDTTQTTNMSQQFFYCYTLRTKSMEMHNLSNNAGMSIEVTSIGSEMIISFEEIVQQIYW